MSDQEGEREIKIEFFETCELDPLGELRPKLITKDLRTIATSKILSNQDLKDGSKSDINWYKEDNAGKYICQFCELSYSTIQTVRNHVRMKHRTEYQEIKSHRNNSLRNKKLKCHICKIKFKDMMNLQKHVTTHGLDNIKKSCPICHALFKEEALMLEHMSNEHKLIKNKFNTCYICGYSTSKLSHFRQHEKTHSLNNEKCQYCDYITNYQPNLIIHERIHTNNKPYICDYDGCNYRCTAKSGLSSHKLKHTRYKNMLYCDKCSYSTVYKGSLKKHVDSHGRSTVRKRF